MKKILGLDLGTNSIGWAMVNEAENDKEASSIIKAGVRTIHFDNFVSSTTGTESKDPVKDFVGGKGISCNAGRQSKHSARINLQRYKLRKEHLIKVLKGHGLIADDTVLCESGNATTFETYRFRAQAANEQVSLESLARVLLMLNKKRGYKSNRQSKETEEGSLIDGMEVAKQLYENHWTPGQFCLDCLQRDKKICADFYQSDLQNEFDLIWAAQKAHYPLILTPKLKEALRGKGKSQTWTTCKAPFGIVGIKRTTKGDKLKQENYEWRVKALSEKLGLEELAIVLQEVNGEIAKTNGYLGAISDRSKELYFKHQTVGQYKMKLLTKNPNESLKNKVFYRQDYLDEFNRIWETQSRFYPAILTADLKSEIRDIIIFYQRPLKSKKGLLSFCEFECKEIEVVVDSKKQKKMSGLRVCPKSSPIFQDFKICQIINNLTVTVKGSDETRALTPSEKQTLLNELSIKEKLSKAEVLKLLFGNAAKNDLNFKEIAGNKTQANLFKAYQSIIEQTGHGEYNFSKMKATETMDIVASVFEALGYNTDILAFDSSLPDPELEQQASYKLWHLLYSFVTDNSTTGNEKLVEKIATLVGCEKSFAKIIASVKFEDDYGSLSAKAMRKILPYMKKGSEYSEACKAAGYNHSKSSLTKEELETKDYADHLELLPKNSLRNPVVEKILNQMVNVINGIIDAYGKPDEIRIEMARELKKCAKERASMSEAIGKATTEMEQYKKELKDEFGIENPSRNTLIRYRLYKELERNGFKTLYSNTYIAKDKIFDSEFDIEHIIPQARLFDDSFSNKTLELRSINIEKADRTAYDFVLDKYGTAGLEAYKNRVDKLFYDNGISKSKRDKLLISEDKIPSGFIERDLRDSQYIARTALAMLHSLVKTVVSTTGSITDRLREDWGIIDIMKELNWEKYDALGLTESRKDKDGRVITSIKDWTKRNDNRHHAMDALTIAFTKPSIIQYLNNLNARKDERSPQHPTIKGIEAKELERDKHGNLRFKSPMQHESFRAAAKAQLESIFISNKARNKVVTNNINKIATKHGSINKIQLTPRGQLHNETYYGKSKRYVTAVVKVGGDFDANRIKTVANKQYREALMARLLQFNEDAKKAFTGKNSLEKNPIFLNAEHSIVVPEKVKVVTLEDIYTIRKAVSKDLKLDKVVDSHIRAILEARLEEYGGDAGKAFSNLDENPIWLNMEKGIAIKKVRVVEKKAKKAFAVHDKRDNQGNLILDSNGNAQPIDYVIPDNNHHVAIYRAETGELKESVVTFFEATERARQGLPIIERNAPFVNGVRQAGWTFLFSMKQNEYFVFPNPKTGFDPNVIDLMNPDNYAEISKNLYRVQTMSSNDYRFRLHLDTTTDEAKPLQEIAWKRITSINNLKDIVKVRIDHIGRIISVGEY